MHELYLATVDEPGIQAKTLVTAYAVLRPDRLWALMVLNKDPSKVHRIQVRFHNDASGPESEFEGPIDLYQYSRKQYELNADKQEPYPIKDQPPEHRTLRGLTALVVQLPAYSITVIRGTVPLPNH